MQTRSIFVGYDASQSDCGRRWYAIRVRSNFERLAACALDNAGYEHLLPTYRSRRRYSDRTREVDNPLFPGYVFGRFSRSQHCPAWQLPGFVAIVGIAGTPAPVDDAEISALQAVASSGAHAEPWPFLQVGDRVLVERGPLSGLEGILVSKKKDYRIIVSITLLQRAVGVEIDRDWVRAVPRAAARCKFARNGLSQPRVPEYALQQ